VPNFVPRDGWVCQAYRYALEPSARQEQQLRSHAGASRFAWNWGLARCQQRHADQGRWYSAVDLHKLWNCAKKADPALAWWGSNPSGSKTGTAAGQPAAADVYAH
jgi:putative transposase